MGEVVRGRRTITLKQKLKAVRIIATGTQFQGSEPSAITLKAMPQNFEAVSYSWTRLRDNKVLGTTQQITVKNGEVDVVETYRVEVKDRLEEVYIDTLSITKVTDGKPGDVGKRGQVIVQREWKEGDIYRNNDNLIDYIYHRATDSWWRLREGYDNVKAGGNPSNQFVQLTSLEHLAVNNFVAENANIGGFIFKNGKLVSQYPSPNNPDLTLDGTNGEIIAKKLIIVPGSPASDLIDQKVKDGVDKLQVSSRNLRLNSKVIYISTNNGSLYPVVKREVQIDGGSAWEVKVIESSPQKIISLYDTTLKEDLSKNALDTKGKDYVFSYEAKIVSSKKDLFIRTYPYIQFEGGDQYRGAQKDFAITNEWIKVFSVIKNVPKNVRDFSSPVYRFMASILKDGTYAKLDVEDILYLRNYQILEGNKDAPWSPALEDLEAQIDDIQIGVRNFIQTKYKDIQIRDSRYVSILFTETLKGIYTIAATRKVVNKGGKGNSTYSLLSFRLKGIDNSITHSPVPVLLGEGETKFTINTGAQEIDKVYIYSGTDWAGSETIHTDLIDLRIGKGNKVSDWTESLEDINSKIKDQEIYTEYSINGTTAWHTPATTSDRFMRQKKGNGAWGVALPFGKDGAKGADGKNGVNGKDGINGVNGANGEPLGDGVMLFTDPDFSYGTNSVRVYVAAAPSRVAKSTDAPTKSTHMMRMINTGQSVSSTDARRAGYVQLIPSRANAVFIHKIIAKFPVGHRLSYHNNAVGTGASFKWLTSDMGTGKFETYMYKLTCGATGSFTTSAAGYVAFNGPAGTVAAPVNYDIAYSTIFDMSIPDRRLDFLTTQIDAKSVVTATLLVGQGTTATAGVTGVRTSGQNKNVAFWAGLGYENREKAPFQVWTDGRLVAQDADIKGKITATSGEFTGKVTATSGSFTGTINASGGTFNNVTATNLTVNSGTFTGTINAKGGTFDSVTATNLNVKSGTFTGTINANAGTFNNVTATNLTVNSGTFTGRIVASTGKIGNFEIVSDGIENLKIPNYTGYGIRIGNVSKTAGVWLSAGSAGYNPLLDGRVSQSGTIYNNQSFDGENIALTVSAAGGTLNNHALNILHGDITGMALHTVFKTNLVSYDITKESIYINRVTSRNTYSVGLPNSSTDRWDGRTVTIMMAGNGYWDIYPGSAALYLHEGHKCGAGQKLHFGAYATRMTITYNSSDNCWYITSINEY